MSSQIQFKVTGMSCDHCKKAVEDAVKAIDGVESVVADVAAGSVDIALKENINEDVIKKAIEEAGYTVAS